MGYSMRHFMLASLCLASTTAWSEQVNFCKVEKVYAADIGVPDKIVYEDCSGVAFLWYAKNFVKASCWEGATDLLEGKCETHPAENNEPATESTAAEEQE